MGEEASVESTNGPIVYSAHHQRRACCPQHIGLVVILSVVALNGFEDTSPTKRVSVAVEVSPTRSGILKPVAVEDGEELRLAGGNVLMGVHQFNERRQPVMGHLDVGV